MKKTILSLVLASLTMAGSAWADGGDVKSCIDQASGLTYSEQLMSMVSCLRTSRSPRAARIVACVDNVMGDNLNQTIGQLQYCILSIDRPEIQEHVMLDSVTCVHTAHGVDIPAKISSMKRCLYKLPL